MKNLSALILTGLLLFTGQGVIRPFVSNVTPVVSMFRAKSVSTTTDTSVVNAVTDNHKNINNRSVSQNPDSYSDNIDNNINNIDINNMDADTKSIDPPVTESFICPVAGCPLTKIHSHELCPVAGCAKRDYHRHDGIIYCGHMPDDGHAWHICGRVGCTIAEPHTHCAAADCWRVDAHTHALCPLPGCKQTEYHIHDGVIYRQHQE